LDKDRLLFLFLDEVFIKNKHKSTQYHGEQVELYCRFNPKRLMNFLQNSEDYQPLDAI